MTVPGTRSHECCQYPGCPADPIIDLCSAHSVRWGRIPRRLRDSGLLPNDGIFDWIAVDTAVRGLRSVRLTWVEREVAAIILYAKGYEPREVQERLAVPVSKCRWQKIRDLVGGDRIDRRDAVPA